MAQDRRGLPDDFVPGLRQIVGDDAVLTERADCWPYGYDNSRRQHCPDAVVFATTHEQVQAIVRLCYQAGVALTTRGRGTGTTGATTPIHGGLVLSLERMDRIMVLDDGYIAEQTPGA